MKIVDERVHPLRVARQYRTVVGKDADVGSDVEMGIATLAFGHLAAASPECKIEAWPCDLRGPVLLTDDVLDEPVRYDAGTLVLPNRPGLGARLVPEKLTELEGDLDA
jgi:muconate cycloisomerase